MRNTGVSVLVLIAALAGAQTAGCAADSTERSTERSAGRVIDDSVITAKVKTALIEARPDSHQAIADKEVICNTTL